MRVLLEDRNTIVFRDLRKVLKDKNPPKKIVVFYGAAHMPDLEKRLVEKLGFQPKRDDFGLWRKPAKAGSLGLRSGTRSQDDPDADSKSHQTEAIVPMLGLQVVSPRLGQDKPIDPHRQNVD